MSQATAKFDFETQAAQTAQPRHIASMRYDDAIVILDPDGFITTWNACAEGMYGYAPEDIVGRHFSLFFEPGDRGRGLPQHLLDIASLERTEQQGWRVRQDGSRFPAHVDLTAQKNSRAQLLGFVCRSQDLGGSGNFVAQSTDSRSADSRSADSEAQLQRILQSSLLAEQAAQKQSMRQKLITAFGHFALQNPEFDDLIAEMAAIVKSGLQSEFCRYLVLTPDESALQFEAGWGWSGTWAGQTGFDAVIETEDRFTIGARETALIEDYATETRDRPSPVIVEHGIRSGAEVLVWGTHGPYGLLGVYSRSPGAFNQETLDFLQGIKNTLAAAIDRKRAEDRLAYLAQYDALTRLPNRNLYIERLWQALRQADRDKHSMGVLFVDVDRFKSVNDKLGHSGGDEVLAQVALRLQACVRSCDTVARLSGDEFALLLDHITVAEEATAVADRVIAKLAEPFRINGHEVYVSASAGVSIGPADGSNPDALLKNADTAMYRAKQAGRNTHRFFLPEMNAQTAERLKIETELRGALGRREFMLHYQPKVDIASGRISGFEALLRWNHPQRGVVPPNEFVPILEDTGLIIEVGEWVIRQACEQIRQWRIERLMNCRIAVNLSARQFSDNDLDLSIRAILNETQIDPNLLEFELTESMLMSDSEEAVRVLDSMKKCGIRLSVDDFGTGYSSLAYLKRFPLDSLKIDRAFIRDMTTDSGDATIAKAIISLAQNLKLKVVAEGVETWAQLEFLRDHACDEMQGFLFARPMSAADCARALAEDWRLPE